VLVSEAVLTLSNKVGVLTNKAYSVAPMLVSDLQSVSGDLRGLYEAVLEIEPSREDLKRAERVLRDYPRKKRRLALTLTECRTTWKKQAESLMAQTGVASPSQEERVQGGAVVAVAQRIIEQEEALLERIRYSDKILEWHDDVTRIELALGGLPQRLRSLIACRYWGNLPVDEVCDKLAISRPTYYRVRDDALIDFGMAYSCICGPVCQET